MATDFDAIQKIAAAALGFFWNNIILNQFQIFDLQLLHKRRARVLGNVDTPEYLFRAFQESLKDRLSLINRFFPRTLILGSHFGLLGKSLMDECGLSNIVEVESDLSFFLKHTGYRVVAEEEALPFAEDSFDLVISCLSLQFVNDVPGTLLQIRKFLKPDGLFLAGVMGGMTLNELRSSWLLGETELGRGVSPRVIPFADVHEFGSLLQRAGFSQPVVDTDMIKVTYDSAVGLMHDIRAMGAGNVLNERSRIPVTRHLLKRIEEIYSEHYGDRNGQVFASFELIFMTGWSPRTCHPKHLPSGSAKALFKK